MDFISTLGYDLAAQRRADDRRAAAERIAYRERPARTTPAESVGRDESRWHHLLTRIHLARPHHPLTH